MAPIVVKYAQENGFGMILDTSKQWPQSPVLMAGEGVDITKAVVDIYNTQSGVAASCRERRREARPAPRDQTGTVLARQTGDSQDDRATEITRDHETPLVSEKFQQAA